MIPPNVLIGNKLYTVHVLDHLKHDHLGYIDYDKQTIEVSRYRFDNTEVSPKELEHAFWHEVTHGILKDMHHKLESSEKFVDAFGLRLAQIQRWLRGEK